MRDTKKTNLIIPVSIESIDNNIKKITAKSNLRISFQQPLNRNYAVHLFGNNNIMVSVMNMTHATMNLLPY